MFKRRRVTREHKNEDDEILGTEDEVLSAAFNLLDRIPHDVHARITSGFLNAADRARMRTTSRREQALATSQNLDMNLVVRERNAARARWLAALQQDKTRIRYTRNRCEAVGDCTGGVLTPGIGYVRGVRGPDAACREQDDHCGTYLDEKDDGTQEQVTCCRDSMISSDIALMRMTLAEAADIVDSPHFSYLRRQAALVHLLAHIATNGDADLMPVAYSLGDSMGWRIEHLDNILERENARNARSPPHTISTFIFDPDAVFLWAKMWKVLSKQNALLVLLAFLQLHADMPVEALARMIREHGLRDRRGRYRIPDIDEDKIALAKRINPTIEGLLARLRSDVNRRDVRNPRLRRAVPKPARFTFH